MGSRFSTKSDLDYSQRIRSEYYTLRYAIWGYLKSLIKIRMLIKRGERLMFFDPFFLSNLAFYLEDLYNTSFKPYEI